jgi:hypothetical protein
MPSLRSGSIAKKADVGLPALDRRDRLGGGVEGEQHEADPELVGEAFREVHRDADRVAGGGVAPARIGLPRLIEARSFPVGASAAATSGVAPRLLAHAPARRKGEAPVQVTMRRREIGAVMRRW